MKAIEESDKLLDDEKKRRQAAESKKFKCGFECVSGGRNQS